MSSIARSLRRPIKRSGTNTYKWDFKPTNAAGVSVLPMWVADMDFPVAEPIRAALAARLEHPVFGYTFASDAWKESFIEWQARRNGWRINPEHILFAPAVMPAVRAAILAFSEPGDEVIVQPPVYFPFFDSVRDNGRVVVENPLVVADGRYRMDLDHLERVITGRTRIVLLCSPHNPVGRVWRRDELDALAGICERHDLVVIADEIHSDLTRSGVDFIPFASVGEDAARRTVATHSPSKTFNIAGLASSHLVIPDGERRRRLAHALGRLGMTLPNIMSLEASRAAYADSEAWVDELLALLDEQIAWFAAEIGRRAPDVVLAPIEGTYLAWLDLRAFLARVGADDTAMKHALFEDAALWLSDGRQFGTGGEGFFRMNLAAPRETVEEGLRRFEVAKAAMERRA